MQTLTPSRLHIHYLDPKTQADNGQDVATGLAQTPKTLPAHYFYDDYGSQLFEQICDLPEYYPTRTEAWILQTFADAIAHHTGPCELIELGSGSSTKTRLLLDAYQRLGHPLRYQPIDVSAGILVESAKQLLVDYPTIYVDGLVGTYEQALQALPATAKSHRLVVFLGSSLGNFNPAECDRFFRQVTEVLNPGDFFLLGFDLQKETDVLESAYNDAAGVTAAFNLNMLTHLNRRFEGNFDTNYFQHKAIYNQAESQIEMHLYCQHPHTVTLNKLDLIAEFSQDESIRTEISRKFNLEQMQHYLGVKGLPVVKFWTDPKRWFGIVLCQKNSEGRI